MAKEIWFYDRSNRPISAVATGLAMQVVRTGEQHWENWKAVENELRDLLQTLKPNEKLTVRIEVTKVVR